jgi:hypothetical protein
MTYNVTNVFDFYDIFVNELVGDVVLTIILALIIIWVLSIKTKMPLEISILFGMLALSIFYAETQIIIIWVFVVLIIGLMFYYVIDKAFK